MKRIVGIGEWRPNGVRTAQFLKRYSGYTLTGVTRERLLAILYGFGKNGKTTLTELLHEVLGEYARNTDVETLLIKKYQGVGNDVAALKGGQVRVGR